MNGARSIFLRKGYWLTALAAIVLLAASPGTAQAQQLIATTDTGYEGGIKVEVPKTVVEGNSATITVSAKADVEADTTLENRTVTVTLSLPTAGGGADTREEGDAQFNPNGVVTLVFPANAAPTGVTDHPDATHTVTGRVSLQTTHDPDAENEDVVIDASAAGGLTPTLDAKGIEIDDDEPQTYVFKVSTQDPKEGPDAIAVTLRADPAHVDDNLPLTLHSDDPKYTIVAPNTVTISVETPQAGAPVMVTPPTNDGNRVEDSFTLTAYSGAVGNSTERASVTIKVADANALPAVEMRVLEDGEVADPQPTSVPEGESVMVVVMPVNKDGDAIDAEEELKVALRPTGTADSADYTLVGAFTIPNEADISNTVEIEVRSDEDVGMESLMFDAVVSGEAAKGTETSMSAGVLSLYIDDATTPQITPKSSDADYDRIKATTADLNPGETVELMTSDLFDVEEGFSAGYSVSVEGTSVSAFASGEVITINAEVAGRSEVTVTGTASMSSSSLMPSQTVSNVASLKFPVEVVDTELVVALSADPMEIEAGGTTMITATANRAVTVGDGAVTIELTVVGDGTLDPESITIAMGDMSGSATLTANESVTVVATGSGVSGLMQVMVTVTEPAPEPVPALPLIAQWLLGLGLMGGGARKLYRRRRQGS